MLAEEHEEELRRRETDALDKEETLLQKAQLRERNVFDRKGIVATWTMNISKHVFWNFGYL